MPSPLTPLKNFGAMGHNREGGDGGSCGNPWILGVNARNPLISQANTPTKTPQNYTRFAQNYTFCSKFPTWHFWPFSGVSLFISFIYNEKKKKERPTEKTANPRVVTVAYFLSHGFWFAFRKFRGNPWDGFPNGINDLGQKTARPTDFHAIFPLGGVNRG